MVGDRRYRYEIEQVRRGKRLDRVGSALNRFDEHQADMAATSTVEF